MESKQGLTEARGAQRLPGQDILGPDKEEEERRRHLGLPPPHPQISLCLGCDLGSWFLRQEKAQSGR